MAACRWSTTRTMADVMLLFSQGLFAIGQFEPAAGAAVGHAHVAAEPMEHGRRQLSRDLSRHSEVHRSA